MNDGFGVLHILTDTEVARVATSLSASVTVAYAKLGKDTDLGSDKRKSGTNQR